MNVILFGHQNCGKTTLGKLVATQLGRTFMDIDELYDMSPREIVKRHGEKHFRQLETSLITSLNVSNAIIAVGGGTVMQQQNQKILAQLGKLIYLRANKNVLKARTLASLPAYLDPHAPEDSFEKMYQQRASIYEKIDALSIDLDGKNHDQILLELITLIEAHG